MSNILVFVVLLNITLLITYIGGYIVKYILVYLRKMSWTNSSGISGTTWAYTSNPKRSVKLFGKANASSSFNMKKAGDTSTPQKATDFVTVWLNELSNEEAKLYQEEGLDVAYACIPEDDVSDVELISQEDYQSLMDSDTSQQDSQVPFE